MKTVLITGCSSGYGLETARHFHAQGWNVIATMRTPREDVLRLSERLRILPLDVTKPDSIAALIEGCGPLDVLVNNAGIGVVGVFDIDDFIFQSGMEMVEQCDADTDAIRQIFMAIVDKILRARSEFHIVEVIAYLAE